MSTILLVIIGIITTTIAWGILISLSGSSEEDKGDSMITIFIIAVVLFVILGVSQCS